ncbi:MAG: hypothetical protein D6719_08035 [Candidatus Dadabacteria bacterium]|nr:MAG: hypothetical protein D6719_08035 [Candidatus Dadabacteria bacterium]
MKLDPAEQQAGLRWLIGAGLFAVALSVFLYRVDIGLSTSQREKVLGETLREIRTAQAALKSADPDPRQLNARPLHASHISQQAEFNHSGH